MAVVAVRNSGDGSRDMILLRRCLNDVLLSSLFRFCIQTCLGCVTNSFKPLYHFSDNRLNVSENDILKANSKLIYFVPLAPAGAFCLFLTCITVPNASLTSGLFLIVLSTNQFLTFPLTSFNAS